jgi:hypothetical protein
MVEADAAMVLDAAPDAFMPDAVSDAFMSDAPLMRVVCDGPAAVVPSVPVIAPDLATYLADIANVPSAGANPPTTLTVDPSDCQALLWAISLPLGSAFVHVIANDDGSCALWLGGEEENPEYNGRPLRYCRLPPSCTPVDFVFDDNALGGSASLDSPWCVPTSFCTDDSCTE